VSIATHATHAAIATVWRLEAAKVIAAVDIADCERWTRSAAAVTVPASATATKYSS